MRGILTDKARDKRRVRHGKGLTRVDFEGLDLAIASDDEVLMRVDDAPRKPAAEDPVKADLVKLRYPAGPSIPEAGQAPGLSSTTVKRHWTHARAWLHDGLTRPQ